MKLGRLPRGAAAFIEDKVTGKRKYTVGCLAAAGPAQAAYLVVARLMVMGRLQPWTGRSLHMKRAKGSSLSEMHRTGLLACQAVCFVEVLKKQGPGEVR